jgi:hypothetical protein
MLSKNRHQPAAKVFDLLLFGSMECSVAVVYVSMTLFDLDMLQEIHLQQILFAGFLASRLCKNYSRCIIVSMGTHLNTHIISAIHVTYFWCLLFALFLTSNED